jgi:predicted metal-binding protein
MVCTSCSSDDAGGDGQAFYDHLKAARKEQGLKPWFRLKPAKCLDGCDTPCNARIKGGDREKVVRTWLDAREDVQPLLDAARRYAETGDTRDFPGRPG